nr:4a-hydroxytetrahydrobiopterin dehydratase [Sediminibacterium roseum]
MDQTGGEIDQRRSTGGRVNQRTDQEQRQHGFLIAGTDIAVGSLSPFLNLNSHPMWTEQNNKLYRKFTFKDFSEAFAFMTRVALAAEKMDHHPSWTNTWNTVEISLSTHDAGDVVTGKDRELAKKIDAIAK